MPVGPYTREARPIMATKKTNPTPSKHPKTSKSTKKSATSPAGSSHDFDKAVRAIVAKSHVPLTLKQIHARHKTTFGDILSTGSIEESVVSLVKGNKLSLTRTVAKSMTLSLDAVSVLISDDPEIAIPQVLCLPPRLPLTNHEIFRTLRDDLNKTNMSRGAVDDALASLTDRGIIQRCADQKYSCNCP